MKPIFVVAICLAGAILPSAQAYVDDTALQGAMQQAGPATPVAKDPPAPAAQDTPRRSHLVEADADDKPRFRVVVTYDATLSTDPVADSRCLRTTGTWIKRDKARAGGCVIGNGEIFAGEH